MSAPKFAKELGSVIIMIDLVIGYTAIQSMAKWARNNDMILHLHRAGHGDLHSPKNARRELSRDRQVDAAWPASTTSMPAPWSASWKAIPATTKRLSTTSATRGAEPPRTLETWRLLRSALGVPQQNACRSPRAAFTPGRCTSCSIILARTCVLQFGGGTIGHPHGIEAGATANRVALEAMIYARNAGRDYLAEGPQILAEAAKTCTPLQQGARHLEGRHLQLRLDRQPGLRSDGQRQRVTRFAGRRAAAPATIRQQ